MAFRINDYNAFLSSLYDKNGETQSERPKEEFPVDFDFGLSGNPPNSLLEGQPLRQNTERSVSTSFLEGEGGDRSLPNTANEDDFNPYGVNFMPQDNIYIKQDDLKAEDFKQEPFGAYTGDASKQSFSSENFSKMAEKKPSSSKLLFKDPYAEEEEEEGEKESPIHIPARPRVKSAHNVIEQRYRNKINLKFNVLQNLVPTLRVVARRKQRGGDHDEEDDDYVYSYTPGSDSDDLEGLEPARKLNKGTILAKSIEYIKFLELKNERMKLEHDELLLKAKMLGIQIDDL